jgi:transcriptional regulator with XRE-family HTH domain
MTQAQLARALEVQQNVVARLEDNGRPDPRLSTVVAISQALGISIDVLVAEAGLAAKRPAPAALQARYHRAAQAAHLAREHLAALDAALAEIDPKTPSPKRLRARSHN